ncbi:MAG: AAA family ATPase, partial [Proteobacteria bacterium]|nr:AAA family ATPase [Pseudomonadota bacterium]
MHQNTHNPELELAWDLVEKTDRSIYLTGKAGTGKTTFLHKIKAESRKRLIVVAPTGVAAINAQGVTIHSFFQLPFGPIIPGQSQVQQPGNFKMRFGRKKIDIIRSLDLLIIDEISMVRADLLDGIDQVLRRYKNRDQVFGGIQVLMIGDLQQLAPVVKPNEWNLLSQYYETVFFFSSHVYQQANTVAIELQHIYRQDNQAFISLLNEVRNNQLSNESAIELNKRHMPNFTPADNDAYITLTTHNNRAQRMNDVELAKLAGQSYTFEAEIKGKFNEHAYPTDFNLILKKGAQVMFIKNDSSAEKRYFNGKMGEIVSIDSDEVIVECHEDGETIAVTPEIWENIKYNINQDNQQIQEERVGSFSQIPLRLAWAITIHKSQGLTFDKVIIDAEASFAHGQTYVALSRCRSIDGIVLKSPITASSIITDASVMSYINEVNNQPLTHEQLVSSQKTYQLNLLADLFDYSALSYPLKRCISLYYQNRNSLQGNVIDPLSAMLDFGVNHLLTVKTNFHKQLLALSQAITLPEEDEKIQARIKKGVEYFLYQTEVLLSKQI